MPPLAREGPFTQALQDSARQAVFAQHVVAQREQSLAVRVPDDAVRRMQRVAVHERAALRQIEEHEPVALGMHRSRRHQQVARQQFHRMSVGNQGMEQRPLPLQIPERHAARRGRDQQLPAAAHGFDIVDRVESALAKVLGQVLHLAGIPGPDDVRRRAGRAGLIHQVDPGVAADQQRAEVDEVRVTAGRKQRDGPEQGAKTGSMHRNKTYGPRRI